MRKSDLGLSNGSTSGGRIPTEGGEGGGRGPLAALRPWLGGEGHLPDAVLKRFLSPPGYRGSYLALPRFR